MALASCSRSHSSAPPAGTAADLQGIWKLWTTETGQVEVGPAALFAFVSGSTVSGPNLAGTVQGNKFELVADVQLGTSTAVGTLNTANTCTGTYTTVRPSGAPISGTFRMEKFAPAGFVSIDGTVRGQSLSHRTNQAIGIRKFLDRNFTQMIEAEVVTGSPSLNFELDFEPKNLAVGTLKTGKGATDVGVAVEFSTGTVGARAEAIGGSIIITRYGPDGFAATFSLDLDSGDTITGVIDIKFDLQALHPFGA